MKIRFLSVIAAVALLGACESAPTASTTTGGTGTGTGVSSIVPGSQQDLVANVGDRVFFDYDSFALRPEARAQVEKQANWLKKYPNVAIAVEGHADERGTREYNLALGERRANSVKSFLVSQGIPAARLKTVSYGKERPVALGSNESAWTQNRRGVLVVQ
ncbi:MAG: peptidoglycan-associated lipoprotein Pal [Alphaproteobacteria bacterium]|nr:peptidoglycan-associated lipoprotein Pal [Alphaproteobacteria bacterium]MBF0373991.1 peptidoglycan-associated lipoprotein Pal [Alphaproteobacteria bacterium]MBF0394504.1 peptidoglycan-associated lipoprotein Pal [Alphaproteobacteria bacterium]